MQTLTPRWTEYELLDSGAGRKLERFGEFVLIRPEPQAKWKPALTAARWESAHGQFVKAAIGQRGDWKFRKPVPQRWEMRRGNLRFWVQPAPSGHVGVFPDQACHWDWIAEVIGRANAPVKVLCLFGHTGLASLTAAAAGAEVTHVDASRQAVALARENQRLSGLDKQPIRWIFDDALKFVRREARRGNRYDALMLDPPRFGRGPDGEIWKLEDSLPELLNACAKVLHSSPLFVLVNVYSTVLTQERIANEAKKLRVFVEAMVTNLQSQIVSGELAIKDAKGRKVSASVFARAESGSLS